jgi:predicted PurR-regulated permease PerM
MNTPTPLSKAVLILFLFFLVFTALYIGKPFFVPFTFGAILSMLLYPYCKWMEKSGLSRGLASFLSVLSLLLVIAAVLTLLGWQLAKMSSEMSGIEDKVKQSISQVQIAIQSKFGVSKEQQQQFLQKQQQSGGGSITTKISSSLSYISSFLVDTLLTFVYIFLLLYFRLQLRKFVLKTVSEENKALANKIIFEASKVSQKYISGMGLMIVMLWVMYGIGFSIVGVKNAIFFAILCGILEIIPFVGNLTGTALTIIGSVTQGGSGMVVGILVTYAIVQFVQTYLLEPLVVGSAENINPLFTIIILVVGELVWGVPGMVLALPLLGIVKVVFDNIESLQLYGYLIGKPKKDDDEGMMTKVKKWFK